MSDVSKDDPGHGPVRGPVRAALVEAWALVAGVTRRPVAAYEWIARTPTPRGGLVFIAVLAVALGAAGAAVTATSRGGWGVAEGLAWGLFGVFGVYLAASAVIWTVGRLLGSRGSFEAYLGAWAGSYVPTAVWFAGMLFVHLLAALAPGGPAEADPGSYWFPPGLAFQLVFFAFSVVCFLWKSLLLYLTLRVVGGLDFRRIVAAAAMLAPVAIGYWALGLYLGWFKVPFI